jgi:hypothetical protein
MNFENLISVKEYASLHGVSPRAIQFKIKRGTLKAIKRGDIYLIDKNEPYVDARVRSGKYVNARAKSQIQKGGSDE